MNSRDYINLLDDVLITYLDEKMDENTIFQQDNTAFHKSGHSMEWFATKQIPILDWPACFSDLKPIENL
jgi:hypothetical protein